MVTEETLVCKIYMGQTGSEARRASGPGRTGLRGPRSLVACLAPVTRPSGPSRVLQSHHWLYKTLCYLLVIRIDNNNFTNNLVVRSTPTVIAIAVVFAN